VSQAYYHDNKASNSTHYIDHTCTEMSEIAIISYEKITPSQSEREGEKIREKRKKI